MKVVDARHEYRNSDSAMFMTHVIWPKFLLCFAMIY